MAARVVVSDVSSQDHLILWIQQAHPTNAVKPAVLNLLSQVGALLIQTANPAPGQAQARGRDSSSQ